MPSAPPPSLLRAMGAYEEALAEAQREYRRMAGLKGAAREAARQEYERAIARARALADGLRAAHAA